jgi:hypothetical protein
MITKAQRDHKDYTQAKPFPTNPTNLERIPDRL